MNVTTGNGNDRTWLDEIYRLNLSTVTASDLNTAAVPEPSSVLMLGSAA